MSNIKGQLKDYLRSTGKDIAKAVGKKIKKKGIDANSDAADAVQ